MKYLTLETGTRITRVETNERTGYPIASLAGSRGGGWFERVMPESTIIVACAPVDAISAGFAVPMAQLFKALNLCDATAAETTIATLEAEIATLQRKIKRAKK